MFNTSYRLLLGITARRILPGVVALILSFGTLSARADTNTSHTVLLLGDSLSAAYGVPQALSWPTLLSQKLPAETQLHNASISGETTAGGLKRLPSLIQSLKPTLVMIELGGNDGLRGYPLARIRQNLQRLITISQDNGAEVLLVGMQIPPNYGKRYAQGFRDLYPQLAQAHQLTLLPFLLEGIAGNPKLMQADRIHPNEHAQQQIVQNVLPLLLTMLNEQ